jgi:hypothetical protein
MRYRLLGETNQISGDVILSGLHNMWVILVRSAAWSAVSADDAVLL